jgi:prepilin-type N-terminal cleavage/methylation domain-containing protein
LADKGGVQGVEGPPGSASLACEGPDSGLTLIEVLVSTTVMSIAVGIFTGAVRQIYTTLQRTEAMSTAQASATTAFQRLDRELRYASQVNTPWSSGSDYYVEYLMTNGDTPTCVQLRSQGSSRTLQRRQWQQGTAPAAAWLPLVSEVVPAYPLSANTASAPPVGSVSPFAVIPADTVFLFQKLQVNVQISGGANNTAAKRQVSVTFTALNSAPQSVVNVVCAEGRVQ